MLLTASLFWFAIAIDAPRFPKLGKHVGGALAWGDPLCIFAQFHPGTPMILGNNCVRGFVPTIDKEKILS